MSTPPRSCLIALALLAAAPRARAHDSEPADPPPAADSREITHDEPPEGVIPISDDEKESTEARPGWLSFRPTELDLELGLEWERRRVGVSGRPFRDASQRNEDLRLTESLALRFDGDVLDPRFIAFDGGVKLGLSQEEFEETIDWLHREDRDTGVLLEYDLSMRILPEKPVSGTAYARRGREHLPRRFLPSLVEDRDEAGGAITFREGRWTTEAAYDFSDVDRTGNRADRDNEHLRREHFSLDNRWEISDDHRLRIAFDHEREESRYQGTAASFDTRRDQLRVEHELRFGPAQRHRLDTYLRWNNEQGDLARDELEFTPRLRLRHGDAFETVYRYSLNRVEQDAIETNRHRIDWEAILRPGERLRMSTDLFWLRDAVEHDIEAQQTGGVFDTSYHQRTGAGEFRADAVFAADQYRTLGSGQDGVVRGESHVLDSTRPTHLVHSDVLPYTVRAYNAARTRIFVPGRDYRLITIGRRTTAYRLLSGAIGEGDAVVFDYHYRVPTGSRVATYRTDVMLEHAFDGGVTPYYGFELRRQEASGSLGFPVFEDHTERHRAGLRYRREAWSVSGEFESLDDSIEPYDAWHFGSQATLVSLPEYTLDAGARASRYHFSGAGRFRYPGEDDFDARRAWVIDVDATQRVRLDPYWSASLATAYRWEYNTAIGETNGVDVECGLHYERGRLSVDLSAEYDLLSLDASREEGYGLFLTVRRDLSHLFEGERVARR